MNRHQKNAIGDIRLGLVHDIFRYVQDDAQLNPAGFDAEYYSDLITQLDMLAQIQTHLSSALRLARDISIVTGDALYGMALLWYRNIQMLSERRVPGAEAIYRQLRTHFRNRRNAPTGEQPTEAQVLRDVKAVLHGKKDGEIVVAGRARHTTQGSHTVVDDTHKPMTQNFKETVRGVICSHCNTHNAAGHKFCRNFGKELIVI